LPTDLLEFSKPEVDALVKTIKADDEDADFNELASEARLLEIAEDRKDTLYMPHSPVRSMRLRFLSHGSQYNETGYDVFGLEDYVRAEMLPDTRTFEEECDIKARKDVVPT